MRISDCSSDVCSSDLTMPLRELIDRSINQVLMRCLFTSLATFLAMLPMAVWGGRSVENFTIPLVVGVVIATTSSIYIAAPILLFLGVWRSRRKDRTEGALPAAAAADDHAPPGAAQRT